MAYDLEPLRSYVRFYLAVLSQLERVWSSIVAIEAAMHAELGPFADDLAPVPLEALRTLVDAPREPPKELAALWRPEDAAELDGLNDVYEVVGRFTFEGEEKKNLARVQALVATARNVVIENARALAGLEKLASVAKTTADELETAERRSAAALRVERTQKLEPLAELVLLRAKQTQDALRAVPVPGLEDGAGAGEEYKRLRAKLQQVYQTCLPFLRNALAQVWHLVAAPVPQAFPDELPLVAELPPELLALPVAGSDELERAERTLAALAEETTGLKRAKEEIATRLAKLDGEIAGVGVKREETNGEIEMARALFEWVRLGELGKQLEAKEGDLERELRARTASAGEAKTAAETLRTVLAAESEALAKRTGELDAAIAGHEELRKKEPLLFGKDEWRNKVADGEAKLAELREVVGHGVQAEAQRKIELSAAEVRVQTLIAEASIADRSLGDVRARLLEALKGFEVVGERLGKQKPTRLVPVGDVEEVVVLLEAKLAEHDRAVEALRAEQKRAKEDGLRVLAREKQIETERATAQTRVDGARVARAEGLEAAQKRLAAERKAAVSEHVEDVLGALGKSLAQVPTVFLDPARALVVAQTEPDYGKVERLRKAAEAAAPVVARLLAERAPELGAAEGLLEKMQTEFCDAADAACRSAWG